MIQYAIRLFSIIFWCFIAYCFLQLPYLDTWFSKENKYLCIYSWADRIDESVLQDFEKQTGIKVYVNHYESNEELLTKLEKNPHVDCDLIVPSGYIIDSMVKYNLLKKIDRTKCAFIDRIYPEFLNSGIEIRDEYAVPLYWDVLGLGFNKKRITADKVTLDLVFNTQPHLYHKKIGMIDDSRQSIVLTALYLGYDLDTLSRDNLKTMRALLNKQKKWVGAYSDSQQGYYLASETCNVVVSEREHICRQMQKYDFIGFVVPDTGSLLTVDYIVMSASTKKEDWAYQLINYLFSYDILKKNCEKFCVLPTCKDVRQDLDERYVGVSDLYPGSDLFKKLKIFKNVLTLKQINDFWIKLKAM